MDGRSLAAAFDMEGGFNNLALTLLPGASRAGRHRAPRSAARDRTAASAPFPARCRRRTGFSTTSCRSSRASGSILPIVFLVVAAFLLNVVLTRIVSVQREQIAALKALGYTNGELAWHYTKLSLVIGAAGAVIGTAGGAWLGSGMTSIYNDFFRFPTLTLPAAARGGRRRHRGQLRGRDPRRAQRGPPRGGAAAGRSDAARSRRRATAGAGSSAPASPAGCRPPSA